MSTYTASVMVNVTGRFSEYRPEHTLAEVTSPDGALLAFPVEADVEANAAEYMFSIGNRMRPALDGQEWPADVRSVSVGDVIATSDPFGTVRYWTVGGCGMSLLPGLPNNPLVALGGTDATSRPAPRTVTIDDTELVVKTYTPEGESSPTVWLETTDGESYADVSVVLPGTPTRSGHFWVKTWSENHGLLEELVAQGALVTTGNTARTGFVTASEAKIAEEN